MKRVYTLYRVSTKKQVNTSENHENDIPMQRGACNEFVKCRQDWEIVKELEEKGVSGFKVSAKDRDAILDLQEAALKKSLTSFWCLCLTGSGGLMMRRRLSWNGSSRPVGSRSGV